MAATLHCCQVDCLESATVEILDLADPNPYTSMSHSCDVHIGELLTHDPALPDEAVDEWLVRTF